MRNYSGGGAKKITAEMNTVPIFIGSVRKDFSGLFAF